MKVNTKPMRDRIMTLVNKDPRYASDDKLLIAAIWYQEGWTDPNLYERLKSVCSAETIRRTRAKLVEEGMIKVDDTTTDARYKEYQDAKDNLGYGPVTIF